MPQKLIKANCNRFSILVCLLFLGICFLSACATLSDPETTQTHHSDMVAFADDTHTLEQTFHSRQKRIDGFFLWIQSTPNSSGQEGKITFEVYNPADAASPWTTSSIKADTYRPDQPVYIPFLPEENATSSSFKLVIKARNCEVQLFGRNEDAYAQGNAFQDGTPLPGDIAFRLKYLYHSEALWQDFISILPHSWLVIICFLFFIIPGSFVVSLIKINRYLHSAERISLIISISIALPVCVLAWTSLFDIRWTKSTVWIFYASIAFLYVLWSIRHNYQAINHRSSSENPQISQLVRILLWFKRNRILLALILIFFAALTVRLIMIRDLAAPPWVDPVHHGLLTRIIMEQGQFPQTYSPYITADNARYHPGYHVMLAFFQWLSGLELQSGMLLFGQLLNAIMVFSVFLLAFRFTRNTRIGVLAALLTGLFTPMPAYYTSWGRYTQLAGLVILPAAFVLIDFILSPQFSYLDNKRHRIPIFLLVGFLCTSLFITHYRVIIFLALLMIAFWAVRSVGSIKNRFSKISIISDLSLILIVVIIAIVLSLPWLPGALAELIIPRIASTLKGDTAFAGHSWAYLNAGFGIWTVYLAIAGLLLGILRRKKFSWILIIWMILMFLMANMNMLKLPMSGYINNTAVEISLFIPISIFGAYFLNELINLIGRWLPRRWVLLYNSVLIIGVIILAYFGAQKMIPILNPDTVFLQQADVPAIHWIENNIPPEETIAINPFLWGYGLYTGADGGFWITPLSGRKTMPPPLLYGFDTQGEIAQYVSNTSKTILEKSADPTAIHDFLISQDIHYIYLGAKGGVFSHQKLLDSIAFKLLYNDNGVWIFKLLQ